MLSITLSIVILTGSYIKKNCVLNSLYLSRKSFIQGDIPYRSANAYNGVVLLKDNGLRQWYTAVTTRL